MPAHATIIAAKLRKPRVHPIITSLLGSQMGFGLLDVVVVTGAIDDVSSVGCVVVVVGKGSWVGGVMGGFVGRVVPPRALSVVSLRPLSSSSSSSL